MILVFRSSLDSPSILTGEVPTKARDNSVGLGAHRECSGGPATVHGHEKSPVCGPVGSPHCSPWARTSTWPSTVDTGPARRRQQHLHLIDESRRCAVMFAIQGHPPSGVRCVTAGSQSAPHNPQWGRAVHESRTSRAPRPNLSGHQWAARRDYFRTVQGMPLTPRIRSLHYVSNQLVENWPPALNKRAMGGSAAEGMRP